MEILFQIFGEAVLQILIEAASDLVLHFFRRGELRFKNPIALAVGFFAWGLVAGGISLWLFPASFIADEQFRLINLFVTPLTAGVVMMLFGQSQLRKGRDVAGLERFGYAFAFAFAMALVRLVFAK